MQSGLLRGVAPRNDVWHWRQSFVSVRVKRDLKVKPVLTKRLVGKFEVPPFLGIGAKARFLHIRLQHLAVTQRRVARANRLPPRSKTP
jgi:hypothetical protein